MPELATWNWRHRTDAGALRSGATRYRPVLAVRLGTIPSATPPPSRNIAPIATTGHLSTFMAQALAPTRLSCLARHLTQQAVLVTTLAAGLPAHAGPNLSEASIALSLAPVALSVGVVSATGVALSAVPLAVLSAGTALVIVSVEVIGGATVWVLERVSDGVRISVRTAGRLSEGARGAAGAAVYVSVIGAGTLLSTAGEVIAFIPNEIGKALLHHEKVTR